MSFYHSEGTNGQEFPYNIKLVREKFLPILEDKMGCHSFKEISENEYEFKHKFSFRYNLNPGAGSVQFSRTSKGTHVKLRLYVNQAWLARIDAWANKCFDLLDSALSHCPKYHPEDHSDDFEDAGEIKIKCPKCKKSFVISSSAKACFCPNCGAKLAKKKKK